LTAVELISDRATRRLLGGVVTGEQDVAGRIYVIAMALQNRMLAEDFERLAYAPPFLYRLGPATLTPIVRRRPPPSGTELRR
jgi:hypothetical protein